MDTLPPVSHLLPIEIWRNVTQNLALQPLELGNANPSQAFCSNRAALRQLCRTSHLFLAIARPYLYETIVFSTDGLTSSHPRGHDTDAASLVLLTRSLAQNPALRPLVKNLAIPITLSPTLAGSSAIHRTLAIAWSEQSAFLSDLNPADRSIFDDLGLSAEVTAQRTSDASSTPQNSQEPVPEPESLARKVMTSLLCMTGQVETLLLQCASTEDPQVFDQPLYHLLSRSQLSKPFLPKLKTLQAQLTPILMSGNDNSHWEELLGSYGFPPLLGQPRLRRLDMWFGWPNVLTASEKTRKDITHIEEMNFTVAAITSVDVLIRLASSLKSLSLELLTTPASAALNTFGPDKDLNEVLLSRSETLERLSLDTLQCSADHVTEQLGPLGKLTCLPKFGRLKHLSVEPHLLLDWVNANTWPRFLDTLPPNLVTLTLKFMPENGKDLLRIWARSGLGVLLRAPREKWQAKVPKLRRICLHPLPFSQRAVDIIRDELLDSGIDLTWSNINAELDFGFSGLTIS